ncbi:MAG: 2-amino-4-hydroxy-6-hydroxymethyldihydropteridine diphosphokinase [Nevskiales bacterium]|nr:2-amino-4-hydroxy-6-hydroxymethyldihydropteridine diphosphokinase [Nevskiales bacterium]
MTQGYRRAYVGLGANLGDPPRQLRRALELLGEYGTVLRVSSFYRSAPMGPQDQPDYCNAVAIIETSLEPAALMQALLATERRCGRVRERKWGPRVLDLDLLHVEGAVCQGDALTLPHPGIGVRAFVLVPWAEIAPEVQIPGLGRVADLAAAVDAAGLGLWVAV